MENSLERYRPLLEAAAFASRAHRHQIRKDGETPYVSHAFRVALVVRDVFGIDDVDVQTAALLHDTLEDTLTDFDDIVEAFGERIAWWVALLSKDKRLPDDARELAYSQQLKNAPWQVKACKLADVFDNLADSVHVSAEMKARVRRRAETYLAVLGENLTDEVKVPFEHVKRLLESMPG
jgi:guanosine-3',5'-bis(diphosphate) 3'-pyrophosphohydrolase